jgi:8-oxo-dGTP pyrophosphatase MutT (NUDIX family)
LDTPSGRNTTTSEEVYAGKLITVRVETLPQPIGGTQRFEIVEHPDAVAIVALRAAPATDASNASDASGEPQVALVRQPRPAIGRETWELPAGLVRPDERDDPQRTAERELREETGYAANTWQRLIREYPSPGFSTEAITLYLATEVYPVGGGPDGEGLHEIDAVDWVPLSAALARGQRGEIEDGKTLLGLTLAAGMNGEETMPRAVVNLPLGRTPTLNGGVLPGGMLDGALKLDGLLLEEFNYAGNSAYQAMEDRARMFSLYLVIIGVLASGLVAVYQLGGASLKTFTQPLTMLLLVLGGFVGVVFFVQLIRLRQAHQESIITMNMIKEYYLGRFTDDNPNIGNIFNWRLAGMKGGERLGSVTFLVCFTVAFLGGGAFAAAAFVGYNLSSGAPGADPFAPETFVPAGGIALAVLVVAILFQVIYYRSALSGKKERAKIKAAKQKVDEALAAGARVPAPAGVSR